MRLSKRRGQDSEGRQACRFASGATDEVRVHCELKNGQADRSNDSAECAGEGGQSHKMTVSGEESTQRAKDKKLRAANIEEEPNEKKNLWSFT